MGFSSQGWALKKTRRQKAREAIKQIGRDYHPIDISTGQWQKPEEVKARLEKNVEEVEIACREAELSESSWKRVKKTKGTLAAMMGYLVFFFHILKEHMASLRFTPEQERFMMDVLIPLAYLERAFARGSKYEKAEMKTTIDAFRKRAREGPWTEEERKSMMKRRRKRPDYSSDRVRMLRDEMHGLG